MEDASNEELGMNLVIGGSGFLGQALQKEVLAQGREKDYIFTYNEHKERILPNIKSTKLNILEQSMEIDEFETVILMINVENRNKYILPINHQLSKLKQNQSLIILSSQAIYEQPLTEYGKTMKTLEDNEIQPKHRNRQSKLWIFRLMYAFGIEEQETRLIPKLARATRLEEIITITNNGNTYLNPLPSRFVAQILIKATEEITKQPNGFYEITNLNYDEPITTKQIIKVIQEYEYWSKKKNKHKLRTKRNTTDKLLGKHYKLGKMDEQMGHGIYKHNNRNKRILERVDEQ
jgi:nucleoside-diphosphate-sugar epimerase